jgi:type II secretory pathway predicted ATPase ExeA
MYNKFFGFSEKPFEVTPDPKFLFLTKAYQEILSALVYGIRERRGFIALVGEVGTGKTLMINALLDRLDHRTKVAFIFNSDLTFKQMLIMAICDLGLATPEENLSKVEAIQRLNELAITQLEKNGYVVIIVDEAQGISHKTMENLRMLSNLETRKHKLLQIILSGQPELDTKLRKPEWRQLVQRISIKRYSTQLSEEDTYNYVQHRLNIAGFKGPFLFNDEALKLIWRNSCGIPRKINIICDNALLIGYGIEKRIISREIIQEAIDDLSWSPFSDGTEIEDLPTELSHDNNYESKEQITSAIHSQNLEKDPFSTSKEKGNSNPEAPRELDVAHIPKLKVVSKPLTKLKHAQQQENSINFEQDKFFSSDRKEARENENKNLVNRVWSSLITRVLILIFLIISTIYLITRS